MTVKELIEKLKEMKQEKDVVIIEEGDSPINGGSLIKEVFEINGSTNDDFVFIQF